jgi:hypothetical protein
MPLSEHEQRLLEQMERALYAEDPSFASSLRSTRGGRASRGHAALGVLAVLAGLGLLIAGVATTVIALGVVGFVAMLIGCVLVYAAFRGGPAPAEEQGSTDQPQAPGASGAAGGAGAPGSSGFMDRMEDRWRRRSEDGQ